MAKVIDEKDLLKLNPHIDKKMLRESMIITKLLLDSGVVMTDYRLVSPFSRRRIRKHMANMADTGKL